MKGVFTRVECLFADREVDNRSIGFLSVTETCASALAAAAAAARVMRAFTEITVAAARLPPPRLRVRSFPDPFGRGAGSLARGAIRAGRAASFPPSSGAAKNGFHARLVGLAGLGDWPGDRLICRYFLPAAKATGLTGIEIWKRPHSFSIREL